MIEQSNARLPTHWGDFVLRAFAHTVNEPMPHMVVERSRVDDSQATLVRIHSECFTGDVLGSKRCDCGMQLHTALMQIGLHGGMLLYLRQEGRGIGLIEKLKAYHLQDRGLDTAEANIRLGHAPDARDYTVAAQMLRACGVGAVRLLTNNPDKVAQLEKHGIKVIERLPLIVPHDIESAGYMETKRTFFGHFL
jgi:3,4-dihydroxy 2-butanone 4-phosphate synthase/GTP cyclohydrolase II